MLMCSTWVALDNHHWREALLLLGLCVTLSRLGLLLPGRYFWLSGLSGLSGALRTQEALFIYLAWLVPAGAFLDFAVGKGCTRLGKKCLVNGSQRLDWQWKGSRLEDS